MSSMDDTGDRIADDSLHETDPRVRPHKAASAQDTAVESAPRRERHTGDPGGAAFEAVVAEEFEARRQLDDALDGISPDTDIEHAEARWRTALQDHDTGELTGQHGASAGPTAECERAINQARQAADRVQHTRHDVRLAQHDEISRAERVERWQPADTNQQPVPTAAAPRRRSGPRRVLVTGSPTWVSATVIRDALQQVWDDGNTVLVTGGHPSGADRIAEMFWRRWGGTIERHPRDWRLHQGSADVCLAFQRGPAGAANTVHLAESAGIPTRVYTHTTGRATDSEATRRPGNPTAPAVQATATPRTTAAGPDPASAGSQQRRQARAVGRELPWQPDAREEPASAVEVATHYSYPEVTALVAHAAPGSDQARIGREALGLLMEQPELFAGGDQAAEIARHLSAAEIERQRHIVGHGPLFEVLGRAAELQHQHHHDANEHPETAVPTNAGPGHEEAVRRARWAVDALNQQTRARRAAEWQAAGHPADWRRSDHHTHDRESADTSPPRDDDPPALNYEGGQP